jgi:uncharacterized protein YggU (UPF0235/DUF167 family)
MRVTVRVTPRATRIGVEAAADSSLVARVAEPATDGRANAAVTEALARHFRVPKTAVTILRGHASRRKLVEIVAG